MAMFIKLFATKIVANNFLGRSNSLDTICVALELVNSPSSNCVGVKEKSATSTPDTNAEQPNKTNNNTKLLTTAKSIDRK